MGHLLISSFTQAIYLVAPDTQFTTTGEKSKIAYEEHFRKYQEFLVKNANTNLGKIIFRYFNKNVFAGVSGITPEPESDDDALDYDNEMEEMQQAIDKLALDDGDSESFGAPAPAPTTTTSTAPTTTTSIAPTTTTSTAPTTTPSAPLSAARTPLPDSSDNTTNRHMSPIVEEEEVTEEVVPPPKKPKRVRKDASNRRASSRLQSAA